eukprot:m.217906 g.217906  ORF g.217906 m.217906 type:complete len:487 (-) comp15894_c1_seq1:75-1535(-)
MITLSLTIGAICAISGGYGNTSCQVHIDNPTDPLHGNIRSGPDLSCTPIPSGPNNLEACIQSCCEKEECHAFSFNSPWELKIKYMDCVHGQDCCCLKSSAPTLGPNTYGMNITTGLVTSACKSDEDCSLNGICASNGSCVCDAEWFGPKCGQLNLIKPQTVTPAYPPPEFYANTTSWGGSVVYENSTKQYHMFVAEMSNSCGMSTWSTNSIIRHAVSSSPTGPFARQEVVMSEFAHNPTAIQAPDGTYLIYHIGCGTGRPGFPPCSHCENGISGKTCKGPAEQVACTSNTTNILYSSSLNGPWSQYNALVLPSAAMSWEGADNPTATFFPNGSLLMLARGGDPRRESSSDGVITAPSWKGPYQKWNVVGNSSSPSVEDPFVYVDHRGNFHALFHKFTDESPGCGGHAYSRDGFDWTLTDEAAYTTYVVTTDNTTHSFTRRERPHLLFDASGKRPTVLYTTLTNWSTSGANDGKDKAFTFAHAIQTP